MHTVAGVVAAVRARLGRVQADPHPGREAVLAPVYRQAAPDGDPAADGVRGAVEGDEEAISSVPHLLTAVLGECLAQQAVVPDDQLVPGGVTDQAHQIGRGDDVGEHVWF